MKLFIGTKIVKAEVMDEKDFLVKYKAAPHTLERTGNQGYHVVYSQPDGGPEYHSWSPKKVFDDCHRGITVYERSMISRWMSFPGHTTAEKYNPESFKDWEDSVDIDAKDTVKIRKIPPVGGARTETAPKERLYEKIKREAEEEEKKKLFSPIHGIIVGDYSLSSEEEEPRIVRFYFSADSLSFGIGFNTADGGGFLPERDIIPGTKLVNIKTGHVKIIE